MRSFGRFAPRDHRLPPSPFHQVACPREATSPPPITGISEAPARYLTLLTPPRCTSRLSPAAYGTPESFTSNPTTPSFPPYPSTVSPIPLLPSLDPGWKLLIEPLRAPRVHLARRRRTTLILGSPQHFFRTPALIPALFS